MRRRLPRVQAEFRLYRQDKPAAPLAVVALQVLARVRPLRERHEAVEAAQPEQGSPATVSIDRQMLHGTQLVIFLSPMDSAIRES